MIILVRHGEATHHTQNLTGGWTDSDLTAKGQAQLKALGKKLAQDLSPAAISMMKLRIMASDLKRAAESANIIADALGWEGDPAELFEEVPDAEGCSGECAVDCSRFAHGGSDG